MSRLRLVVAGADGRMGRALVRAIAPADDLQLKAALLIAAHPELGNDAGTMAGIGALGVALSADPLAAIAEADAVLDFTAPGFSVALAELCAQARIVHVIGTTGFSADEEEKIRAAARHAVIIKSGNMSLAVTVLADLVRQAARVLAAYDIEIVELHHRMKADAPSGTALLLGEAAAKARAVHLKEQAVFTRHGHTGARQDGAIGFASLRGGSVVGEHHVILAGPSERIELSHVAEDRAIFAHGALTAARWGQGRKPGLYGMGDVLGLDQLR